MIKNIFFIGAKFFFEIVTKWHTTVATEDRKIVNL